MSFEESIENARLAVHYFFNNNFEEARKILEPWSKTSMYHALGYSVFEFLEAIMTFEPHQIHKASEALKISLSVCSRYRYKNNILGKMVGRNNYENFTPEQAHAELCFAESLLLKALLSFIEDETLVSFIKAGLKIRSCYNTYKECNMILKTQKWSNERLTAHFESGVKMGVGTFNLKLGLEELEKGYNMKNGIRQILCVMTLLAYNLIVTYAISHKDGDLALCDKILKEQLRLYPKGVWFLFFKGRYELINANLNEAEKWYLESWKSQDVWPQFHHICFWELMWTHSLKQNWRESCKYAGYLLADSKWSRTIYSYQKASLMLMLGKNLSRDEKNEIETLMREAPEFKQRIAGKSLPMEKFAIRRAERFFAQKKRLCLPAVELMYLWNFFRILGKKEVLVRSVLDLIEKELADLDVSSEFYDDNNCLLHLLRGASLRQMNIRSQAEQDFRFVVDNGKKVREDTFLVPFAIVELALLELDRLDYTKAGAYLEDARKNYTGYSLESRLHFKIHAINNDIVERDKAGECTHS
ncbi:UNVERIFIED_CONTAM: hypothetical protein PYX00_004469 [Menopon gallinae]|uniref:Tetratricopeptide repeat protein 39B n=1 Tax=Menopon gallinae TaxID=328185 RepID=A0AAW2I5E9_9NEOP